MFILFVLPLLFPPKHLLLGWNLRVKDLTTLCGLAFCISCIGLLSPRWYVNLRLRSLLLLGALCSQGLVPLGCIVYPRRLECREDFEL